MLELFLIAAVCTLLVVAATVLLILKYYWGPSGKPPNYGSGKLKGRGK